MDKTAPIGAAPQSRLHISAACHYWAMLEAALGPLSAASTADNAQRMDALMHAVLDHLRASAKPPRGAHRLLAFLTEWVTAYEDTQPPLQHASPAALLQFLMDSNGLKQRDLAAELGGQSAVSAILNGKRQVNARQALALGRRFSMSAAAFLADGASPMPEPAGSVETSRQHVDLGQVMLRADSTSAATAHRHLDAGHERTIAH